MQYMQKIQKYAKICTIIPYMDSCIYMRYMRRSGSTRKNRTGWCAYFLCFCIYLRYMQKNEEVCIYIEGVSIFCMLVHMRTNMIFGTSTHASC